MSATTTSFDIARFCRAIEERDSQTQIECYAPDAIVTIADRITQPGDPRVLRGSAEIEAYVRELNARDMTHVVKHHVQDPAGAAFVNACRYPDGTNVMCASVIELRDGQIVSQTNVQAWDEA